MRIKKKHHPRKRNKPKFVRKPTIARRYEVCQKTIELWMNSGRIPFIRIGKRGVRFDPTATDAALQRFVVSKTQV